MNVKHEIRMGVVTITFEDRITTVREAKAFVKLAFDYAKILNSD